MNTIVVLGMHRSGTSLIANVLHKLGVSMGTTFLTPDDGNKEGYWEDILWLGINKHILGNARGDWKKPPPIPNIVKLDKFVRILLTKAVTKSSKDAGELWGFKDPRTCLTIPLIHKFLPNPRYIVVRRPKDNVVKSLKKLHGNDHNWSRLVDVYGNRVDGFLKSAKIDKADIANVHFEDFVTQAHTFNSVDWLANWLGLDRDVSEAVKIIKARR